jgi:hypothetical protein
MADTTDSRQPTREDPLPGWPGGTRGRLVLIAALAALVVLDGLWLGGTLFRSTAWRGLLWVLVAAGLGIGAFAYLRRRNDG